MEFKFRAYLRDRFFEGIRSKDEILAILQMWRNDFDGFLVINGFQVKRLPWNDYEYPVNLPTYQIIGVGFFITTSGIYNTLLTLHTIDQFGNAFIPGDLD